MTRWTGRNIITLCKNHHFLFDRCRLNKDEYSVVKPYIDRVNGELDLLFNCDLRPINSKNMKHATEDKQRKLDNWKKRTYEFFGFYKNYEK